MSSDNAPSTQLHGRKRVAASYARVAIPLPLSKSKSKTNGQAKAAEEATSRGQTAAHKDHEVPVAAESAASTATEEHDGNNGFKAGASASESGVTTPVSNGADVDSTTPANDASSTARKPTQLRTQLPPDFVPFNGHLTPQTAESGPSPSNSQVSSNFPAARPAAAHLVFGSDSSNNPSPLPSAPNAYPLPSQQTSRHSPHASVFIPPSHAHHLSEPYQNHNNGYAQSPSGAKRQGHSSQPFPNPQYRNGPPDNAPYQYAGHVSGRHLNGSHDFNGQPPFQPFQFPAVAFSRGPFDNAVSLSQHISTLFAAEKFSDVQLQIVSEHDDNSVIMAGHKMILTRSTTLQRLIMDASATAVKVSLPGKWHDLRAFQETVSWLYGCNLLGDSPYTHVGDTNTSRLQYALSYISAGLFLGLTSVSQRGSEVASNVLSWDNLHIALEFALEGGLHNSWSQVHAASGRQLSTGSPLNDPAATQLLYSIMDFMVASIPHDLNLDTSAPDLKGLSRLPEVAATTNGTTGQDDRDERLVTHRSSRSVNDPRLSRIRFGNVGGSSTAVASISSILFSLPFPLLSILMQHPVLSDRLGSTSLASLARSVVAERETRRARVSKQVSENELAANHRSTLTFVEIIKEDASSPSGVRLERRDISGA